MLIVFVGGLASNLEVKKRVSKLVSDLHHDLSVA